MNKTILNKLLTPDEIPLYDKILEYDYNGTVVNYRQRISTKHLIDAMQTIVNICLNESGFINEALLELIQQIVILKFWTGIDVPLLDKVDILPEELYEFCDLVSHSSIYETILPFLDNKQIEFFIRTTRATIDNIVKYRNSFAATLTAINDQALASVDKNEQLLSEMLNSGNYDQLQLLLDNMNPQKSNESEEQLNGINSITPQRKQQSGNGTAKRVSTPSRNKTNGEQPGQ